MSSSLFGARGRNDRTASILTTFAVFGVAALGSASMLFAQNDDAAIETSRPLSPAEGLASMSTADGFRIELVASEPLVFDPVAFDWGFDGELWVAEMADYPSGEGGRVVRLIDSDGDGDYDRRDVFLDGLPHVNGVMAWRGGVLVSAVPEILYAEDRDGDGKCDERRTLFRGFSRSNPQHLMNGFVWGLDNRVHAGGEESAVVIHAGDETDEADGVALRGDFRFDPDRATMERESGRTQFGRARNDFGDWFGSTNSDPGFQVVLEERYLARNPHLRAPAVQIQISESPGAARVYPTSPIAARFNDLNKAGRFTSACSFEIYRDDLLGDAFYGNSFVAEPVHNLVHRELLEPRGAVWSSRRADEERDREFLSSSDPWCRPVCVRTGPDGALWIADMYRLVIEHPEWIPDEWENRLDLRAGADRGRIYRVVPADRSLRTIPDVSEMSSTQLAETLSNPNGAARDLAHRLLLHRDDRSIADALERSAREAARPAVRVQALSVLVGLGTLTVETIETALADEDAEVRRFAVRLAEPRLRDSQALHDAIVAMAGDPSIRVRLQVALTLGYLPEGTGGAALAQVAVRDGADPYLRAASLSSALTDLDGFVAGIVDAFDEAPTPLLMETLDLATVIDDDAAVAKLLLAMTAPTDDAADRRRRVETVAAFLESLRRRSVSFDDFRRDADGDLAEAASRMGDVIDSADDLTQDDGTPIETRRAALRITALAGSDEDRARLFQLLDVHTPPELQEAAVEGILENADADAPGRLLAGWSEYGPRLRSAILDRLLSRASGRLATLNAIERGDLTPASLDAARRQALLADDDESVRLRAVEAFGAATNEERAAVVARYREGIATLTADDGRGSKLFDKHCAACHRLEDRGHDVGPDLVALGDRSREALLVAILDPNRAVETKFLGYSALDGDGRLHQGLLVSEAGASVELLSADGKRTRLLLSEIERLVGSGQSLMPIGFEKDLSPQDVADVIAFVGRIRLERRSFPGNEPRVVGPEALRGEFWLLPRDAEIYGPTVTYRSDRDDLSAWNGASDVAVWTLDVRRPGAYRISVEYACVAPPRDAEAIVDIDGVANSVRLVPSGGEDVFVERGVAEREMSEGERRVSFRLTTPIDGDAFRLQSVRLRPID